VITKLGEVETEPTAEFLLAAIVEWYEAHERYRHPASYGLELERIRKLGDDELDLGRRLKSEHALQDIAEKATGLLRVGKKGGDL